MFSVRFSTQHQNNLAGPVQYAIQCCEKRPSVFGRKSGVLSLFPSFCRRTTDSAAVTEINSPESNGCGDAPGEQSRRRLRLKQCRKRGCCAARILVTAAAGLAAHNFASVVQTARERRRIRVNTSSELFRWQQDGPADFPHERCRVDDRYANGNTEVFGVNVYTRPRVEHRRNFYLQVRRCESVFTIAKTVLWRSIRGAERNVAPYPLKTIFFRFLL